MPCLSPHECKRAGRHARAAVSGALHAVPTLAGVSAAGDTEDAAKDAERLERVLRMLGRTRESGTAYAGMQYPAGYHQFVANGAVVAGQRDPALRLALVPVVWVGRTVLDLGCNQGGMVFEALRQGAACGVGVDRDPQMVNAATKLAQWHACTDAHFFVHDLDAPELDRLLDFLPIGEPDVILLMAMSIWLERWRTVIAWAARHCSVLVFESNGSSSEQDEQIAELRRRFPVVTQLSASSDDDRHWPHRRLLVCAHEHEHLA